MFVLCAHYRGTVADEKRVVFDDHVETVHLPMVAKYPGLVSLRYLKGVHWNDAEPPYLLTFELGFTTRGDLDKALQSEIRYAARDDLNNFVPLFDGEIRHVLYEVNDIATGAR
ncbi:MAG: EthD family reductase [Rhodospirillales bacterium]|nr:EthD family reductase [Rhodospirillales bacterium]